MNFICPFCKKKPVTHLCATWDLDHPQRPVTTEVALLCIDCSRQRYSYWQDSHYETIYIYISITAKTQLLLVKQIIAQYLTKSSLRYYLPKNEILSAIRLAKI